MSNVAEIDINEMMCREDEELYKLVNQWKATYHKYFVVTEGRGELADQIAALEGQIVRHTPTTFLGLVKVLQMGHMIMSARDADPDCYIVDGPATILYQGALIMTHRDGFPRFSARSAWCGDAGHRKPCAPFQSHGPSESLGKPPFRSCRRTGSGRIGGGRRKASTMSRRTRGFPPTRPLARRIACPISMGHYQRSLVLIAPAIDAVDHESGAIGRTER